MTVSVSFRGSADGEDGPFDLCSVGAWSAFSQWAETLPAEFPVMHELADDGSAGPTDALATEFADSLQRYPPEDGVKNTVDALAELMGVGAEDELTVVTDEETEPGDPASFAEADNSGKDVALGGPDGKKVEQLLSASIKQGTKTLAELTRAALQRLLERGPGAVRKAKRLFTDEEQQQLADQLAAVNATAELLGRVRIAERADEAERRAKRRADFAEFCGGKGGTMGPCPEGGGDTEVGGARDEKSIVTKLAAIGERKAALTARHEAVTIKVQESLQKSTQLGDSISRELDAQLSDIKASSGAKGKAKRDIEARQADRSKRLERMKAEVKEARASWSGGNKERDAITAELESSQNDGRKVLKESLGKGQPSKLSRGNFEPSNEYQAKAVGDAEQFLDGLVSHDVGDIPPSTMARASVDRAGYLPKSGIVGRLLGLPGQGTMYLNSATDASVVVHEYGHHLEEVPGVKAAANAFLDRRLAGEKLRPLRDVVPDGGFRRWEKGAQDGFTKAFGEKESWYVGKRYSDGSSEIISMGLERLYKDPASFAQQDPDYCEFMVGVLKGRHKKGKT